MEKLIRNTTKVKTYYTIQGEQQNGTADSAVAATQKQTASTKPIGLTSRRSQLVCGCNARSMIGH